ncbi:MAG: Fe-S cluster assembly protein SufB, partial [Acidocella sp. 20-63-7]
MPAELETRDTMDALSVSKYKYGFSTDIEMEAFPKGLNEEIVRLISAKKSEPDWLLAWRLKAYATWLSMEEPNWARIEHPPINYADLYYYAAPSAPAPKSLDEVDPSLLEMYEKLGIPLGERAALAGVAVDAVFDSVSVATTFRDTLAKSGVIF